VLALATALGATWYMEHNGHCGHGHEQPGDVGHSPCLRGVPDSSRIGRPSNVASIASVFGRQTVQAPRLSGPLALRLTLRWSAVLAVAGARSRRPDHGMIRGPRMNRLLSNFKSIFAWNTSCTTGFVRHCRRIFVMMFERRFNDLHEATPAWWRASCAPTDHHRFEPPKRPTGISRPKWP